jgi:hypothetical protein
MADVELVELGAAAIGRGEELAARAPAEAADRVLGNGHGALRGAARRGKRPGLIRAGSLIRHDRERPRVGRERECRPAREAARCVGHTREPIARMEVRERSVWHRGLRYRCHRIGAKCVWSL